MRPPVRRIVLLVIAVGVATVCIRLGFWQLARLQERRDTNAAIEAGLARAAAPLEIALEREPAYRPVTAIGTYLTEHELLLYGRPLDGAPGDHVLTPLRLADGTIVLVDRGWVPFEPERTLPVEDALPPPGTVHLRGVLVPGEEGEAYPEGSVSATVHAVAIDQIAAATDLDLAPVSLLLTSQDPPQPGGLPVPVPLPERDDGPHLSYAIQWFSFAAIAIVGYLALARRDRRMDAATLAED
jgi:surfeit locus 1 family protein